MSAEVVASEASIASSLSIRITSATASSIAEWVEAADSGLLVGSTNPNDLAIQTIEKYVTSSKYSNGKKVRGPLARSLKDFLRQEVTTDEVIWDSVIDKNTGQRDRELNGTKWKVDDMASPIPPIHVGCRCRRVPVGGPSKTPNG